MCPPFRMQQLRELADRERLSAFVSRAERLFYRMKAIFLRLGNWVMLASD